LPLITDAAVKELAAFRSPGVPVVSVYLDVDGRRQVLRQDVERQFDRLTRDVVSRSDGASALEDVKRIADYLSSGLDRSGVRGLAIFACSAHGLWKVVPLPVPVAPSIHVNRSPAVGQLEAVVQELEPLGLLFVDRQRARMFVYQMGELIDRSELFDALPRNDFDRHDEASRGSDRLDHRVDEAALRHLRHAVAVAFQLFHDHGFANLALGGADEILGTVEGLLHPYLRERLRARVNVAVTAGDAEVRAVALEIEKEIERAKEAAVVQQLRDGVGADSRAAAGLSEVLAALGERRVATLVVSQGFVEAGWRCGECGTLAAKGPACPVEASPMERIDDVVEEAVQQAMAQGAKVEVCIGNADLDVLGRVGALLRY